MVIRRYEDNEKTRGKNSAIANRLAERGSSGTSQLWRGLEQLQPLASRITSWKKTKDIRPRWSTKTSSFAQNIFSEILRASTLGSPNVMLGLNPFFFRVFTRKETEAKPSASKQGRYTGISSRRTGAGLTEAGWFRVVSIAKGRSTSTFVLLQGFSL